MQYRAVAMPKTNGPLVFCLGGSEGGLMQHHAVAMPKTNGTLVFCLGDAAEKEHPRAMALFDFTY